MELAPGDTYLSTRCVSWMPVHILFVIWAGPSLVLRVPQLQSPLSHVPLVGIEVGH